MYPANPIVNDITVDDAGKMTAQPTRGTAQANRMVRAVKVAEKKKPAPAPAQTVRAVQPRPKPANRRSPSLDDAEPRSAFDPKLDLH